METQYILIITVILLAFVFDFTNGFHDAANSIATIVATEVLTPWQAVIWAAFFNFIAFLVFKLAVANTIGTGLIDPALVNPYLVLTALVSAISWNIVTWFYGLPSSSSHALIGGLVGAALVKGGFAALNFTGLSKVFLAIIISPLLGLFFGLFLAKLVGRWFKHANNSTQLWLFKRLQLVSSALLSLTHGGNDAQKTMGIIAVVLYSSSLIGKEFYIPFWVVLSCHFFIALGTLSGGWRIVNTMGKKITYLNPMKGCCAETAATVVLFAATDLGIPVSTTHTVTSAIAGVGISHNLWDTQWQLMRKIGLTWIITIPATACCSAILMLLDNT